jgi:uncharacterized protein (UPF0332 family)
MNSSNDLKLIDFYINRSELALIDAKLLFENCSNEAAMSRLYYSCFYSAFALMYCKHKIKTKTHAGLMSKFDEFYHQNKNH